MPGPLSNIVDFIEPLQWIPTTTHSRARRLHDELVELYGTMIMRVKARMDVGEDVPDCLVKTLILSQERENLDWEDMCMLAVAFDLGGISSVSIIYDLYLLKGGWLNFKLPFIDFRCYPVVPGSHLVTPRDSISSPCRA
jgi:hypothetical protein